MIKIREAGQEDAEFIYNLRNEPEARKNSFSPEIIQWPEHLKWFNTILNSPDSRIWVLELDKIPVAQIRYDRNNADTAEISIMVSPEYKGQKLGVKLIEMTTSEAFDELSIKELKGIVSKTNIASQKIFEAAGFTKKEHFNKSKKQCISYVMDSLKTQVI